MRRAMPPLRDDFYDDAIHIISRFINDDDAARLRWALDIMALPGDA